MVFKDLFKTTKKDRIGVLSIVLVVLLGFYIPELFSKKSNPSEKARNISLENRIDSLDQKQQSDKKDFTDFDEVPYEISESNSYTKGALFAFDPNTLSTEGWQELGLNNRIIKTITNYRSKGGKFYKPEDLKKIWGMPEAFYERVKSYISINSPKSNFERKEYPEYTPPTYEKKERKFTVIELNSADSTQLINLPGIGPKLSSRILAFREKLGGFHSVAQIGETYGLPDSTFNKIKDRITVSTSDIRKININSASKDDLKVHPYLRWNLANAIVEYRNQHGPFQNVEDLKKIMVIDEATFKKIAPYLVIH